MTVSGMGEKNVCFGKLWAALFYFCHLQASLDKRKGEKCAGGPSGEEPIPQACHGPLPRRDPLLGWLHCALATSVHLTPHPPM